MQAITTKYLPPTNHRGSRIKATCAAGSVTVPWSHELNVEENHTEAAGALAIRLGWRGEWLGGGNHVDGLVFVSAPGPTFFV